MEASKSEGPPETWIVYGNGEYEGAPRETVGAWVYVEIGHTGVDGYIEGSATVEIDGVGIAPDDIAGTLGLLIAERFDVLEAVHDSFPRHEYQAKQEESANTTPRDQVA